MKKIITGKGVRDAFIEATRILDQSVALTYSPKGRQVGIQRTWGNSILVQDGITVAKEVESEDEFINMAIGYIREAAQTTASSAGDGTTVTTIIADQLIDKGIKLIEAGTNPMVLRKQILAALPGLIEEIRSFSQPVKTKQEIRHVAYVSSRDDAIADAVTEAVEKVGYEGLITPEMSNKKGVEVSLSEGLELNRGYGEYFHFVTNPDRMEAIIEDASVLVLGRKVTLISEIKPLLESVISTGSKNVFIVGDVSGDALEGIVMNKMKGNLSALVVPAPEYGEARRQILEDIALLTGATVVVDQIGMSIQDYAKSFQTSWIGTTKMVIARKTATNVIKYEASDFEDAEQKKKIIARNQIIKQRIETLRSQRDNADSIYDKEKIQERLARLTTGVAVIKIGGNNETDIREKMERAKDAVPAAQSAKEEGIVPGGGVVLLQVAKSLEGKQRNEGEQLLFEALQEPIKKLLSNAGEDIKSQNNILELVKKKGGSFGYDVEQGKVVDLIKAGVIDPTKVIRQALENAVIVSASALTCGCLIAIKREDTKTQMQIV